MELNVPIQIPENFADQVASIVAKQIEIRLDLLTRTIELPLYANRSEVKKILRIGDARLNDWIALGLKVQYWGDGLQDVRYERSEIQRFLKGKFEV